MTIRFILNGDDVELVTGAEVSLLAILREHFHLYGAKCGCMRGSCGVCSVIFNGAVCPSCLIPAFKVRNSEIITFEGFSQTVEYADIKGGFTRAGVELCGYCSAGKYLAAATLLDRVVRPEKDDFLNAFRGIRCRCTESENLYAGIVAAGELRQQRIYGRIP
ncbi:MAG: 2Fe-2S iron-sulfur cluster binding domain-containing protein [Treponema sp.]|jgi:carbon-monoxide dehydrogenase small subunit|nr:2Fe-2S iron-sulfur cluster binding domain-containing protein [Treponema sp.]